MNSLLDLSPSGALSELEQLKSSDRYTVIVTPDGDSFSYIVVDTYTKSARKGVSSPDTTEEYEKNIPLFDTAPTSSPFGAYEVGGNDGGSYGGVSPFDFGHYFASQYTLPPGPQVTVYPAVTLSGSWDHEQLF